MTSTQSGKLSEWDVAFSVLHDDRMVGEAIAGHLPDSLDWFIYTEQQDEMGGEDLADVLPKVFRTARLCVVLYREKWGDTPGTDRERDILRERWWKEGDEFLLIVKLEPVESLPWPGIPRTNVWRNMQTAGPEGIAKNIVRKLEKIDQGGSKWRSRVTRHTIDGAPLKKSVYQRHSGLVATEQTTPVEYTDCDQCGSAVRFRPIVRARLSDPEKALQAEEVLCAPCADEVGIAVVQQPGIEVPPAERAENPTTREWVTGLLDRRVLAILSQDKELGARGVSKVGCYVGRHHCTLLVSCGDGQKLEVSVDYRVLEQEGALREHEVAEFFKSRILDAIAEQKPEE